MKVIKKMTRFVFSIAIAVFCFTVIAFAEAAEVVAASDNEADYQEAVLDISMLGNLMIHDLNNTDKHYLIISNNYFNVFDSLDIWVDVVDWFVAGQKTYYNFDSFTDNFIEYYETAAYFAQENNIDFGIFNLTGELRIFEYVGGSGLPPVSELPDIVVMPNGIYNLMGYFGAGSTTSTAVNQYYQDLQDKVLQKYFDYIENLAYGLGYQNGYDEGYALGEIGGYDEGYDQGYQNALELAQEDIYNAYNEGYRSGKSAGFREGYKSGQAQEINTSWLTAAVSSITQVLNIQVFGSITIAMLVFFPLLVSLIFFILRLINGRG